jgi:hypothetical protein
MRQTSTVDQPALLGSGQFLRDGRDLFRTHPDQLTGLGLDRGGVVASSQEDETVPERELVLHLHIQRDMEQQLPKLELETRLGLQFGFHVGGEIALARDSECGGREETGRMRMAAQKGETVAPFLDDDGHVEFATLRDASLEGPPTLIVEILRHPYMKGLPEAIAKNGHLVPKRHEGRHP